MKLPLLINFFLMFACTGINGENKYLRLHEEGKVDVCLTSEEVSKTLKSIEKVIVRIDPEEKSELKIVRDDCWKKRYARGKWTLIVYKNPSHPDQAAKAKLLSNVQGATSHLCLTDALVDVETFMLPYSRYVLEKSKEAEPELWADPDVGPVQWIECNKEDLKKYYKSLGTLLHESLHELHSVKGSCHALAQQRGILCFDFVADLPTLDIISKKAFSFKDSNESAGYETLRALYLHEDQSLDIFLDELFAYTVSTDAAAAILRTKGKELAQRELMPLPMILAQAIEYLQLVRDKHSAAYKNNFEDNASNQKNLATVFRVAEESYAAWLRELEKAGAKEKESEHALYLKYANGRKELGW